MIFCENKSPRKLCESVEAILPSDAPRLTRRPYNHFQPTMTSWWLVPSTDLPFFKFGKFSFTWDENIRDTISCGLYLSKGMDPMLKSVYSSKKGRRLIMSEDWAWHKFAADCRNGNIGAAIHNAALKSAGRFSAIIEAGYVDDPGLFDPQIEHPEMEMYTLDYDVSCSIIRPVKVKRSPAMCLKVLNKAMPLATFCQTIEQLGHEQFLWMNVCLAANFGIKEVDTEIESSSISASEIWEKVLSNFLPWIS